MYQTEQSSHSVTVLKKKFDDIKKSIQNIEQKQKEFFTTSHSLDHSFLMDRAKPSTVDSMPTSPLNLPRRDYEKDSPSQLQRLERENSDLANQVLDLSNQNKQLQRENSEFREKVAALEAEVRELKQRIRPQQTDSRELYTLPRATETYQPRSTDSLAAGSRTTGVIEGDGRNLPRSTELYAPRPTESYRTYEQLYPQREAYATRTTESYSSAARPVEAFSMTVVPSQRSLQRPQTAGPELRQYTPRDYSLSDSEQPSSSLFTQTVAVGSSKSRPSSIIRNARSPPKHNRVAFKSDVEVTHIDKEEPAAARSQTYFYQSKPEEDPPRYASAPYLRRQDEDAMAQSAYLRRDEDFKAAYYRREDTPRDYSRWTNYYKRASFE